MQLRGQCHCGAVRFNVVGDASSLPAHCRACSCAYCRRLMPRWWSDPGARLTLHDPNRRLTPYRFGTQTADFLFCASCGVLIAAVCELDGSGYAVLNLNNADGLNLQSLRSEAFSYDGETVVERLARRRRNWMLVSMATR